MNEINNLYLHGNRRRSISSGFLLSFTSSFGQTFFVTLFAGHFHEKWDLSPEKWALLYSAATILTALALAVLGHRTDQRPIKPLICITLGSISLICLGLALMQTLWHLVCLIIALRLTAYGALSHLYPIAMLRSVPGGAGKAIGISSLGLSLGEAVLPSLSLLFLSLWGWQITWILFFASTMAILVAISYLWSEPDGKQTKLANSGSDTGHPDNLRRATRHKALKFWATWPVFLLNLCAGIAPALFFFHQTEIAALNAYQLDDFAALYPILSAATIASAYLGGKLLDRFGTAPFLPLYLLPVALAYSLSIATGPDDYLGFSFFLIGAYFGVASIIHTLIWVELFGASDIGALRGMGAGVSIFGAALTPACSGLLLQSGITLTTQMSWLALIFVASSACAIPVSAHLLRRKQASTPA